MSCVCLDDSQVFVCHALVLISQTNQAFESSFATRRVFSSGEPSTCKASKAERRADCFYSAIVYGDGCITPVLVAKPGKIKVTVTVTDTLVFHH